MAIEYVFSIRDESPEMTVDKLGGKGYHLSVLAKIGAPVPLAVVLTTDLCKKYQNGPVGTKKMIKSKIIPEIKRLMTEEFGYMPLVSVRSGAKVSMPGMMDTVLNVGLDAKTYPMWQQKLGKECVANCHDRLLDMFGDVVHGKKKGTFHSDELPFADVQLLESIEAVFKSWNNDRAKTYRKLHGIPETLGTAVVVQAMVYGNADEQSCTGVLFTRDPSNGDDEVVGEFLVNAQGEDVVAGTRTPRPLKELNAWNPAIATELLHWANVLEDHFGDMQDVEFTVQSGKLYLLQTRKGKRTAQAALKITVDMVAAGKMSLHEAVSKLSYKQYALATKPVVSPEAPVPHAIGVPASNGVATGVAVFSSADAVNCKEPCILVSEETTPDDIAGMNAAVGILTSTGGSTSHAAVVARGMDKVCVVGCEALKKVGDTWVLKGSDAERILTASTKLTIDGATGRIWVGEVPVVDGSQRPEIEQLVEMVFEKYGILRVVEDEKQVKEQDSWFAAFMFEDEEDAKLVARMEKVLSSMKSGVIDLRSKMELMEEEDSSMHKLFGASVDASMLKAETRNGNLLLKAAQKVTVGDVHLVLGKLPTACAMTQALQQLGFKVVPTIKSLEDLILSDGKSVWPKDSKLPYKLVEKVLKMKEAIGEGREVLEPTADWNPKVLTMKGTRLAMTKNVVLSSLFGE